MPPVFDCQLLFKIWPSLILCHVLFEWYVTLFFRSSIECASKCLFTPQCSAFHFDNQKKTCQLGSDMKLVTSPSLTNQDVAVYSYGAGQKLF